MHLFQFWHDDPPADVLAMMEATRLGQRNFEYVRLDDRSARAFVGTHYGARELAVWDACALPAMRSDMLRLLLMDVHGGIYADATYRFPRDLRDLVDATPVGLMPLWACLVVNNLLIFREAGHPFIRACIALLIENVEQRRYGSALIATGPAIFNSIRSVLSPSERDDIVGLGLMNDEWTRWGWPDLVAAANRLIEPTETLVSAYQAISLMPIPDLGSYADNELSASHRGEGHWRQWQGSIYR